MYLLDYQDIEKRYKNSKINEEANGLVFKILEFAKELKKDSMDFDTFLVDTINAISEFSKDISYDMYMQTLLDEMRDSGSIGTPTWTLNKKGTLTIKGNGAMSDYQLWYSYKNYITTVIIEKEVTDIGNWTFAGYTNLTSITIPSSVTGIGDNAFACCKNLISITIPNSIPNIGRETFAGCSNLTSVIIGNSVISIGDYAFCDCNNLTSISIPNNVTDIGKSTFNYCINLKHIHLQSEQPPIIEDNTFDGIDKDTCILHVPSGSKKKYANAEGWREFKNIQFCS